MDLFPLFNEKETSFAGGFFRFGVQRGLLMAGCVLTRHSSSSKRDHAATTALVRCTLHDNQGTAKYQGQHRLARHPVVRNHLALVSTRGVASRQQ